MEIKVVLKGRFDDTSITNNVFYFTCPPQDSATVVEMIGYWMAEYLGWTLIVTSASFTYFAYDVFLWDTGDDDWYLVAEVGIGEGQGQADTSYNANQDAAVLIARTGDGTNPGKKFIPAIADGGMVNGVLTGDMLDDLANVLAWWITVFDAGPDNLTPVIISKIGHIIHPIVGGVVDLIIGSQRRRKPGVGI